MTIFIPDILIALHWPIYFFVPVTCDVSVIKSKGMNDLTNIKRALIYGKILPIEITMISP